MNSLTLCWQYLINTLYKLSIFYSTERENNMKVMNTNLIYNLIVRKYYIENILRSLHLIKFTFKLILYHIRTYICLLMTNLNKSRPFLFIYWFKVITLIRYSEIINFVNYQKKPPILNLKSNFVKLNYNKLKKNEY